MQLTETTPDNKIRLSPDVLAKAEEIAQTWGLKNSRAAVEAVFRKYADEYNSGREYRQPDSEMPQTGDEISAPEPIRCECRSLTSDATVAIWYHGDGDTV